MTTGRCSVATTVDGVATSSLPAELQVRGVQRTRIHPVTAAIAAGSRTWAATTACSMPLTCQGSPNGSTRRKLRSVRPLRRWQLVFFGDNDGVLHAVDVRTETQWNCPPTARSIVTNTWTADCSSAHTMDTVLRRRGQRQGRLENRNGGPDSRSPAWSATSHRGGCDEEFHVFGCPMGALRHVKMGSYSGASPR